MELGYWAGRLWISEVERVKQSSFVGELAGFLRGKKTLKCIGKKKKKKNLLGGVMEVLLSAVTATAACCQFPNIKLTFLSTRVRTKTDSGNRYNNSSLLSLVSTLIIILPFL